MVASTKAPSFAAFVIVQPSPSCHGVARPRALSGLFGTVRVQFNDAAACAAVWFMLIAAPVPSTGSVARSPSGKKAVCPLAKVAAGGTTALVVAGSVLALAHGVADAGGLVAGSVVAGALVAGSVTAGALVAGSVTAGALVAGSADAV